MQKLQKYSIAFLYFQQEENKKYRKEIKYDDGIWSDIHIVQSDYDWFSISAEIYIRMYIGTGEF